MSASDSRSPAEPGGVPPAETSPESSPGTSPARPSADSAASPEFGPDPRPVPRLRGPFDFDVRVPGSKSITNRLYVLAALARGRSRIRRPLRSADCDGLLAAMATCGIGVAWDGPDVLIDGGDGRLPGGGSVNLGHGGTPARFMIAAACLAEGPVTVDGSLRMRERPVAEGVDMLRELGATIDWAGDDGRLPVTATSAGLEGGRLRVGRTASSQFVSAVMLVAPWTRRGVTLELGPDATSPSYVELTRRMLAERGLVGDGLAIPAAEGGLPGFDVAVEPDASSAIYWYTAAAMTPGARAVVRGAATTSVQPDARLLAALAAAGATVRDLTLDGEPAVEVVGPAGGLSAMQLDASDAPDGALAIAAACATAPVGATSRLTGLETLRVKECDRLAALETELGRCGVAVRTGPDWIEIDGVGVGIGVGIRAGDGDRSGDGPAAASPAIIETYDDHRVAMALALLGLQRGGMSVVDPACVAKSYPEFWVELQRLVDAVD
ncbi:MAG: 3-phosphoshikimate 1-carboxyvinyltransferase [Phycisphaerales bacterium]